MFIYVSRFVQGADRMVQFLWAVLKTAISDDSRRTSVRFGKARFVLFKPPNEFRTISCTHRLGSRARTHTTTRITEEGGGEGCGFPLCFNGTRIYMQSFALTTRTAFIANGPDIKSSPSNTKSRTTTFVIVVLLPLLSRPRQPIRGTHLSNDQ